MGAMLVPALTSTGHNVVLADPSGIQFTGAGSCSASKCHGNPTPKPDDATSHNENTTWNAKDEHAKAYTDEKRGLVSPKSKEIATKMGLGAGE